MRVGIDAPPGVPIRRGELDAYAAHGATEDESALQRTMPRGLSTLQKTILRLALEGRDYETLRPREPNNRWNGVDVYTAEIFAVAFLGNHDSVATRKEWADCPGAQKFSLREIGEKEYRAAKASISRAIRRLEERGLVTASVGAFSRWTGVALTEAGLKVARNG